MTIKLTNTCRVTLVDSMGHDLRVADAARVSMNKQSAWNDDGSLAKKDAGLIRYLSEHDHWTPFGHVVLTLRIAMPIFTARQWFKHTIGCVRNEVSRRYVSEAPEYFLPDTFRARPDGSIKQGSGGPHYHSEYWRKRVQKHWEEVDQLYEDMILDDVAPEQARIILPMAHMTEFYETASLAFYARAGKLRLDSHAQGEIQDFMKLVQEVVEPVAPVSWDYLCGSLT